MNKETILRLIRKILIYTRSYFLTKPFYSGIGHILMFHRVCPERTRRRLKDISDMEVTTDLLEKIIKFFLNRNYQIISLNQMFQALNYGKVSKRFVLFTFDDGYSDNLIYAYPIFKKYQIPFAINVTTSFPDREAIIWWYLLEDFILENKHVAFQIDNTSFEFSCSTMDDKNETFRKIKSIIMDNNGTNYISRLRQVFETYKIDMYKKTDELALSWKQIKQLSADPLVTIGAHSVNHLPLNKLPRSVVKYEMLESKKILEAHIDGEIEHFAYPFGSKYEVGKREFKIAKECCFKTAMTSRSGSIYFAHNNYFECLPRISISSNVEEDIRYLHLLTNGTNLCLQNRFKRIITI